MSCLKKMMVVSVLLALQAGFSQIEARTEAAGSISQPGGGSLSYAVGWNQPGSGPALVEFQDWADQYVNSTGSGRTVEAVATGLTLAKQRRAAFLALMQSNP